MLVFPNSKINLGLSVLNKREDGFHNIETVFYPIPLNDCLEIVQCSNQENEIQFTLTGLKVDGKDEDNLCIKAYYLLKKDFPQLPDIKMHLHKTILMGAGLGGGSADAAFALKLINEKFNLNISTQQLIGYALQLGSDCPFFILNKPCIATSRGEAMEEINIGLSSYKLVLVNPGIHIDTGWAFSQINTLSKKNPIKEIINQPVGTWKDSLINDFEGSVSKKFPEIKNIKEQLYQQGATYASMSGSGSTVYGLFEKNMIVNNSFPDNYFVTVLPL